MGFIYCIDISPYWKTFSRQLIAWDMVLLFFAALRYAQIFTPFKMFVLTMGDAANDLAGFSLVTIMMVAAIALTGHISMGESSDHFRTLFFSVLQASDSMANGLGREPEKDPLKNGMSAWWIIYFIVSNYVLMMIFGSFVIAILCGSFDKVREDMREESDAEQVGKGWYLVHNADVETWWAWTK